MKAGKLRHKIDILAPRDSLDTFGDDGVIYVRVATVAGSIEPLAGTELYYALQMRTDVTHKITMRYRSDITAAHRLQWNGRTYEPGPPLSTDERGVDSIITAKEIRNLPLPPT